MSNILNATMRDPAAIMNRQKKTLSARDECVKNIKTQTDVRAKKKILRECGLSHIHPHVVKPLQ